MTLIKQRTSFFVFTEDESPTGYVNSIRQDPQVIKLPSNSNNPISRQDKLEINVNGLKERYRELFDKIGIFHVQFDDGELRTISGDFESMFLENDNLVEPGLVINVAPQGAKSMEEYEELSQTVIDLMLIFMNIEKEVTKDQLLPVFYKEWFRTCLFEESLDPIDMVLHLWKYVTNGLTFPIDDLEGLSGFEFIYDKKANELKETHDTEQFGPSLILYFKELTKPVTLTKFDTKATETLNEVGIFVKSSKDIEETNYVYSGYLFEMSDSPEIILSQTMLQIVPNIRPMFYHSISHEIVEPYGIHPIYRVKFDTIEEDLKKSLKLEPAFYHDYKANNRQQVGDNDKHAKEDYDLQCGLKMTLDLPKSVFIDQYQLQSNREYREFFPEFQLFEEPDLELPSYKIDKFGLSVKMHLNSTKIVENGYEFELPLHLRYLEPIDGGLKDVVFPKGNVYWECQYEKSDSSSSALYDEQEEEEIEDINKIDKIKTVERQMKESLFYETRLNEQSLVDLKSDDSVPFLFTFKDSADNSNRCSNYLRVAIPVGDYDKDGYLVEMGTLVMVLLSSIWILKRLFL